MPASSQGSENTYVAVAESWREGAWNWRRKHGFGVSRRAAARVIERRFQVASHCAGG